MPVDSLLSPELLASSRMATVTEQVLRHSEPRHWMPPVSINLQRFLSSGMQPNQVQDGSGGCNALDFSAPVRDGQQSHQQALSTPFSASQVPSNGSSTIPSALPAHSISSNANPHNGPITNATSRANSKGAQSSAAVTRPQAPLAQKRTTAKAMRVMRDTPSAGMKRAPLKLFSSTPAAALAIAGSAAASIANSIAISRGHTQGFTNTVQGASLSNSQNTTSNSMKNAAADLQQMDDSMDVPFDCVSLATQCDSDEAPSGRARES